MIVNISDFLQPLIYMFCVLQIDVLEDPVIRNVIVLQTVLQEVRHRSAPVYKRLKDIIHEKEKHFYTFTNEHHRYKDTINFFTAS